ncbi:MAG: NAD(P)/FAD-dependent oxidoreductase [Pirellula sp.]|jgi:hypothetical protein|nr:NAD(P)/FAD-dependent oxidoreductase [Pirellula sp.]
MIELAWDPEVETPATIAIIGGGPTGIEAAIYARFLGYHVSIFETRRVAHRMHDWHDRLLGVPVAQCTTPLGMAAIKAQNPEFLFPAPDKIWTGKEFADEYLVPLAKTDLLFDDIHFLSTVSDVSRCQSERGAVEDLQERCNDEFRLLIAGQHRGEWISKADVVLDCRGCFQSQAGLGPGGGLAIGEKEFESQFLKHSIRDRKFEAKQIRDKVVCLVGSTWHATLFAQEFWDARSEFPGTKLIWVVPQDRAQWPARIKRLAELIQSDPAGPVQLLSCLGIDKIQRSEAGKWSVHCVRSDETITELSCDELVRRTTGRGVLGFAELDNEPLLLPEGTEHPFITREPGYYSLHGSASDTPIAREYAIQNDSNDSMISLGTSLKDCHLAIRDLFAMLGGRENLDLYQIMADNIKAGRV